VATSDGVEGRRGDSWLRAMALHVHGVRLSLGEKSGRLVDTMTAGELEALVREGIPEASVKATDLNGGGDHFELMVVSGRFEGRSMVERHRMVYGALGDAMRGAIHALRIQALTPEQFKKGLIGDIGRS